MIKHWQKLNTEKLADYYIFRARIDTSVSPRTGQEHNFVVLESPDWINIIPITPAGNVILIHQYRHGIEDVMLEVPGGMVDPDESDPMDAARREMLEETGYESQELFRLGHVTPNPAFLNNRCYSYVAFGTRFVSPPQFDGAEDIKVEEVPLDTIPALITSGRITHSLVINAFYFLEQFRREHPERFVFPTG